MHALIASFHPDALRVARRLVRSQAEAEDLAQTALMNVLARAHAISDPAFVRPYLMTTVRNLWRNQLRAGNRDEPAYDQTLFERIPAEPVAEEPTISGIDADTLRVAMETLSKKNLELIQLRYVERLDYAAIGNELGISAATARQRVHRAREQLRTACFDAGPATTSARVCQLTRVRLARYIRGALSRRISARVTLHVRTCDDCRASYSQLIDLFGFEPNPDLFPEPEPEK
jgi:RNA polymerase sigma factor (sigma-70 family)